MTVPLDVAGFKSLFDREFVFGSQREMVTDNDVQRALNLGEMLYNDGLWDSDTQKETAFGYVSAHFLELNIKNSGGLKGLNGGLRTVGNGPISAKSVGPTSLTYALPESITNDRILSGLMKTEFGMTYLQLITPRMVGNMVALGGDQTMPTIDANVVNPPEILSTGNFNIVQGFYPVYYAFYTLETTEPGARLLLSRPGTIRGLIVKATLNTLDAAVPITFFKNGVAQTVAVSLAAASLYTRDNTNSFKVVAGDEIDIKIDLSASTLGQLTGLRATVIFQ